MSNDVISKEEHEARLQERITNVTKILQCKLKEFYGDGHNTGKSIHMPRISVGGQIAMLAMIAGQSEEFVQDTEEPQEPDFFPMSDISIKKAKAVQLDGLRKSVTCLQNDLRDKYNQLQTLKDIIGMASGYVPGEPARDDFLQTLKDIQRNSVQIKSSLEVVHTTLAKKNITLSPQDNDLLESLMKTTESCRNYVEGSRETFGGAYSQSTVRRLQRQVIDPKSVESLPLHALGGGEDFFWSSQQRQYLGTNPTTNTTTSSPPQDPVTWSLSPTMLTPFMSSFDNAPTSFGTQPNLMYNQLKSSAKKKPMQSDRAPGSGNTTSNNLPTFPPQGSSLKNNKDVKKLGVLVVDPKEPQAPVTAKSMRKQRGLTGKNQNSEQPTKPSAPPPPETQRHWFNTGSKQQDTLVLDPVAPRPLSIKPFMTVLELRSFLSTLDGSMKGMQSYVRNIQQTIPNADILVRHPGTRELFQEMNNIFQQAARTKALVETKINERVHLKSLIQAESRKEYVRLKSDVSTIESHSVFSQRKVLLRELMDWMQKQGLKLTDARKYAKNMAAMKTRTSETEDSVMNIPLMQLRTDVEIQNTVDIDTIGSLVRRLQIFKTKEHRFRNTIDRIHTLATNIISLAKKLEVQLTCKVCQSPMTECCTIWPCGHNVCGKCIQAAYVNRNVIRCPECLCLTQDGYVNNVTITDIAHMSVFKTSGYNNLETAIERFMQEIGDFSPNQTSDEEFKQIQKHIFRIEEQRKNAEEQKAKAEEKLKKEEELQQQQMAEDSLVSPLNSKYDLNATEGDGGSDGAFSSKGNLGSYSDVKKITM